MWVAIRLQEFNFWVERPCSLWILVKKHTSGGLALQCFREGDIVWLFYSNTEQSKLTRKSAVETGCLFCGEESRKWKLGSHWESNPVSSGFSCQCSDHWATTTGQPSALTILSLSILMPQTKKPHVCWGKMFKSVTNTRRLRMKSTQ